MQNVENRIPDFISSSTSRDFNFLFQFKSAKCETFNLGKRF